VPILARPGKPSVNLEKLNQILAGTAQLEPLIAVQSPEHWETLVHALDDSIDAIFPLSNPAYPTEIWNSHPFPLVKRGLPVVFWSLIEHDEPDFWRFAARDMLNTLGADVHIVRNNHEGLALMKAFAMKRFLKQSKIVVFGEQNFPWNANATGFKVTETLGMQISIRPIQDFRDRYDKFTGTEIEAVIKNRLGIRFLLQGVQNEDLQQAVRTYLAIREILIEEQALGFGVNCFGDLIIQGGRDVPCLAQLLLREEGYIAACDGDFIAMTSMVLGTYYLEKPCMTSNLYPVSYVGALTDHFGDPLSPGENYSTDRWKNIARMAHCGFVGVVSPEMAPNGQISLRDWGGTYEIHRDGRGCGIDAELCPSQEITVYSLNFGVKKLMATHGKILETTRHSAMPHCESSLLLELDNLHDFFEDVSRDHVIVMYGDHRRDLEILANVLGLNYQTYRS
jgi:L-fucose isomerase-like protein